MNEDFESSVTEMLELGSQIDSLYREQLGKHVSETRRAMFEFVSHSEWSQYLEKVDNAAIEGRRNRDFSICSNLLMSSFRESPIDGVRFHERYDALCRLRRAQAAIAVIRDLESPESIENLDFEFGLSFEAQFASDKMTQSYPHWASAHTPLDPGALRRFWIVADPPALVKGLEPKRQFFKAMGTFWSNLRALGARDVAALKAFQQSTQSRTPMAERMAERELLLMTSGYLDRTVNILEERIDVWSQSVQERTARVAFAGQGIFLSELSPAGRRLYSDLSKDLCRSLSGDFFLERTSNVIADMVEQIQAASPPVRPPGSRGDSMGLALPPLSLK